jgi:hypothetical protein
MDASSQSAVSAQSIARSKHSALVEDAVQGTFMIRARRKMAMVDEGGATEESIGSGGVVPSVPSIKRGGAPAPGDCPRYLLVLVLVHA